MREIKFRGKTIKEGKWIVGHLTTWENVDGSIDYQIKSGHENCSVTRTVIPESIGQYTGQKDKNEKEIYENDIVEGGYKNPLTGKYMERLYLIVFDDLGIQGKLIGHSPYGDIFLAWIGNHEKFNREVVGNAYDNPELLEEK